MQIPTFHFSNNTSVIILDHPAMSQVEYRLNFFHVLHPEIHLVFRSQLC